nr:LOW QUALITY PROTEIN: UNC93-like protein MFSD11 [Cherax quadricarinatus]
MKVPIDTASINVGILGLAYMFVFTSFQTQGNMQQVVIKSIKIENPNFVVYGYTSLEILLRVFRHFQWLSPSCLSYLGPKSPCHWGITYAIFIAGFLWPQTVILYLTSVLVGAGAALIWTGQGNYLTLMSTQKTMSRNSGIFWAMLQSSMLFGNLFVFYQFMGKDVIDHHTRTIVFSALTVVGIIGIGIMCLLPKPGADGSGRADESLGSPFEALKKSFNLFRTKDMILLSATFFYTGIELSFFSGVYSACLSSTLRFPDPKRLVGLSGMFIGAGEILVLISLSSFHFSEVIAMMCSFLLGFGDACFNTQIYSILGTVYEDNSGPAFALFKFTQSLSAAACFFYSSVFELYWHLAVLVVFATIGTLTFCSVEWRAHRRLKAKPDTTAFD